MRYSKVRAAVALAAVLALPAVDAAVYRGIFDPVDFEGEATFDIPDSCISAGPGFVANDHDACTVTWLSATITLKEPPATPLTFSYDPAFLPSTTAVEDIFVAGGALAGVNSVPIGPVVISGDPNPDFNGPWWIEFLFSPPDVELSALAVAASSGAFGFGIVNLYTGSCTPTDLDGPLCVRFSEPVSVADVRGFELVAVPEPATLVLMLAALGAASLLRRRGG